MWQFETSLNILRGQPIHLGHIHAFHKAKKVARSGKLLFGSPGKLDFNNWFTDEDRFNMAEAIIKAENLKNFIIGVSFLKDVGNDMLWVEKTFETVGPYNVVVTNNSATVQAYDHTPIPVLIPSLKDRSMLQGSRLRDLIMDNNDGWKKFVHPISIPIIEGILPRIRREGYYLTSEGSRTLGIKL